MSAVNAKVQEPSMEEILASIRRIIADDQTAREGDIAVPEVQTFAPADEPPERDWSLKPEPDAPLTGDTMFEQDDVLDLADHPEFAAPADTESDVAFRDFEDVVAPPEPEPEPEIAPEPEPVAIAPPEPVVVAPPPAYTPPPPAEERLISRDTDAAVSSAFASLANTILTGNARTLEDLVGDMLRPMLKTWLDDNLPVIVERLVKAEIERVARGGR